MSKDLRIPVEGGSLSTPPKAPDWEADESRAQVIQFVGALRRRWWLILLTGLVAATAAWWVQRNEVARYSAEVLIQRRSDPGLTAGAIAPGLATDFATQSEILRSRAVLAGVVDSLGLQLVLRSRQSERSRIIERLEADADAPRGRYLLALEDEDVVLRDARNAALIASAGPGGEISGPGFRLWVREPRALREPIEFSVVYREVAIESLRRQVRIEPPGRGTDLIRLRITNQDPQHAADVVNALAASYRDYRGRAAREALSRRREVIANQLVRLADSLNVVQAQALEHQQRLGLLDPRVEGNALLSALLNSENELRSMRFQEGLLASLVTSLRSGSAADTTLHQLMNLGQELVPIGPDLHRRLRELETERARLTASRFGLTEGAPSVQVVDSLISATKTQMRAAADQSLTLLRTRIAATESRVSELRQQIGALPAQATELAALQQRVDAVQRVFDMLVRQHYETQIAEGVEMGDVDLVDTAPTPVRPDPSGSRFGMTLALMAGLLLGCMATAGLEWFDTRIRTARDAARAAQLPILGVVPKLARKRLERGTEEETAVGLEVFRALRTNISFATTTQRQVLAVTSALAGEGKSTVAANLALAFWKQGMRVLLVDADLRCPMVHQSFRVAAEPGLADVLRGQARLEDAIRQPERLPGLSLLPAGSMPTSSPELLSKESFVKLLVELRSRFDAVILDTPPVLVVADAIVVARAVDTTLVVARSHATEQHVLHEAVDQLRRVNASVVGLVLNGVPRSSSDGRYSSYYKYYQKKGRAILASSDSDRKPVSAGGRRG